MTQATAMANYPQKYTWGILTYFLIFSASLLASLAASGVRNAVDADEAGTKSIGFFDCIGDENSL